MIMYDITSMCVFLYICIIACIVYSGNILQSQDSLKVDLLVLPATGPSLAEWSQSCNLFHPAY